MTQRECIEQAARESKGDRPDRRWWLDEVVDFTLAEIEKATAKLRTALNKYSEDELLQEDKARKADRQAREECARIAEQERRYDSDAYYNLLGGRVARQIAQAIRATIKP